MRLFRTLLLGIAFTTWVGVGANALDVPAKPALDKPIVDASGTLNAQQVDALVTQVNKSRTEKAYQIGILMIPSLEGRAIEDYSLEVARSWGIGDKTNNGVLLLIAKDDRLMRIEVGSGLEGDLTDIESGRIIRNTIAPQFKQGNYYEGISKGVESIQAQVEGRAQQETNMPSTSLLDLLFPIIIFATMIISWFGSLLARSRSWWAGGIIGGGIGGVVALLAHWSMLGLFSIPILGFLGLLFDYFVSKNFYYKTASGDTPSWWAGGNWIDTGGFGGGGGSFGGGGFSGGGASGGW